MMTEKAYDMFSVYVDVVTVVDGSEDCYLFVKIEKSTTLDKYISYTVASGWTELDNVDGVYYRVVNATDRTKSFSVLANDQVTGNKGVTKADMEALKAENATQPTLTFTAYAVQKDNIDTAALAWEKITNPSAKSPQCNARPVHYIKKLLYHERKHES